MMRDELPEIMARYEDVLKLSERLREDEVACSYLSKVRKMLEVEIDLLVLETTGKMEKPDFYRAERELEAYMLMLEWKKDTDDNDRYIRFTKHGRRDAYSNSWGASKEFVLDGWKLIKEISRN